MDMIMANSNPCRSVTAAEVAHYHDKGWVQLRAFIAPEMIASFGISSLWFWRFLIGSMEVTNGRYKSSVGSGF